MVNTYLFKNNHSCVYSLTIFIHHDYSAVSRNQKFLYSMYISLNEAKGFKQ